MVPWNKRFLWKPSFLGSMLNLGSVYTSSTRSVVKRVVPGADHLSPAARVWPAAKSTPPVTWPRFRSRFRTEGETFLFQKKRHVFVGLEVWKSVFFLVTWLEFGNFNLKYLDMIYIYIYTYICLLLGMSWKEARVCIQTSYILRSRKNYLLWEDPNQWKWYGYCGDLVGQCLGWQHIEYLWVFPKIVVPPNHPFW